MENVIEEVKNRIDIVQYIGQYITLKKAGRNFKALCPFHEEKSPSFMISPDRQLWRCFGACHDGGDVISFIRKLDNLTFYEALEELARYAGVKFEKVSFNDTEWNEKEILIKINNLAAKYFNYLLTEHETGKAAREYLEKRGVNEKLIHTFQLGYSPPSWDSLHTYLIKKGSAENDILRTGLIIKGNKGRSYDRFRNRIMFPLIDHRNTIVGFSGRLMNDEPKEAKYINTPETLLYHKRETLFGINVTRDSIRKENKAVIVEGEFDMISCFKHGITNCVAIKGSAFTKEQLSLLKRYTHHLVLALDSDLAGEDTSKRALEESEKQEFRVDILQIPEGKDPDEALKENPIALKKALAAPIPIYDFIFNTIVSKKKIDNPYEKSEISDEFIPYIALIENPIIEKHYIKRLAQLIDTDESSIEQLLNDYRKKKYRKFTIKTPHIKPTDRYELLQKHLIAYLLQHKKPYDIYTAISQVLTKEDFALPAYWNILEHFRAYYEHNKDRVEDFSINTFIQNLSPEIQNLCDELIMFDLSVTGEHPTQKDMVRMINETRYLSLKRRIKSNLKSDTQSDETKKLMEELKTVEKSLNKL
ncbi:DNA primase [Candidatus Roizmanbacteria bacterium RIFCSPLOWO2_01_FULL_38_11]|uniref:DNA primase n=1 Tax=Candidatus Roizmanbacteria bacterium RIFCSPLOWO2_01_FULL_38_11 TaxID=1802060 RepID=A0A1F7IJY8_9BACT|nr:MAG: DNA primase [Candidatus Roizmanbacteria bacterium RIFCSPLOWO2_01_FULL_38_11]